MFYVFHVRYIVCVFFGGGEVCLLFYDGNSPTSIET